MSDVPHDPAAEPAPPPPAEGISRVFPIFSVVASVTYFLCMGFNWTAVTYYPLIGVASREFLAPEVAGPPMFWYGWLVFAALFGAVAAGLAALLPRRIVVAVATRGAWLVWVTPLALILATAWLLRHYALG
jgi:hypothetical protein